MYSLKRFFVTFLIKFIPETRGFGLKRSLYRFLGCTIGEGARICSSCKIFATGKVIIGKDVWLGPESIITSSTGGKIEIEDYVTIGVRVIIVNGFHEITPQGKRIIDGPDTTGDILIQKGSLVNTASIVLPGKIVGKMSHVAAGSVVTKDVPEYTLVAGVPARVVKDLRITL